MNVQYFICKEDLQGECNFKDRTAKSRLDDSKLILGLKSISNICLIASYLNICLQNSNIYRRNI
jgi:hypothetical protein